MAGLSYELNEFDGLAMDVVASTYDTFKPSLQRWLDFIDETALLSRVVTCVEQGSIFKNGGTEVVQPTNTGQQPLSGRYLASKFADNAIGSAATAALLS